jgi:hypothetical protein
MGRMPLKAKLEMPTADIEVALAWLRGEVGLAEIALRRGKFNASNSLAWVAPRLREAWRRGLIRIEPGVDKRPGGVV